MNIKTVKHQPWNTYSIAYLDGGYSNVHENDPEVLAWIAAGNVVAPEFTAEEIAANTAADTYQANLAYLRATDHKDLPSYPAKGGEVMADVKSARVSARLAVRAYKAAMETQ